jgi:hypothetical protein
VTDSSNFTNRSNLLPECRALQLTISCHANPEDP